MSGLTPLATPERGANEIRPPTGTPAGIDIKDGCLSNAVKKSKASSAAPVAAVAIPHPKAAVATGRGHDRPQLLCPTITIMR